MPKMQNEPLVFGVIHSVLKPRTKPSRGKKISKFESEHARVREKLMEKQVQSGEVLRLLKALRQKGAFPKRIALEAFPQKKRLHYTERGDWKYVADKRYFQAVIKHARKNGAKVIELEHEPIELLFHNLYWILTESALHGRDFLPHVFDTHASNNWKKKTQFSKAILKMALEVNSILGGKPFSKKWALNAFDFSDALSVHRSILMHEQAVGKGVDAMVIGGVHASHLKQLGLAVPRYTYRDNSRVPLAQMDLRNYLRYQKEIKRLHRIARQFFPQAK